ncbi:MAG: hypothetical protein ACRDA8_17710, partial [Shewanella sp.]
MRSFARSALTLTTLALTSLVSANDLPATPHGAKAHSFINDAILPAALPWHGASQALMRSQDNPWATPFERSLGLESPNFADTIAWLDQLASANPQLQ